MLQIFRLSLEAVFPILILIALGYLLRRIDIIAENMVFPINRLVFRVFLPCNLFCTMLNSDFSGGVNFGAILYAAGTIIGLFVFLMLVVPRTVKEPKAAPVIVQAIYRSNFGLLGIIIAENLCESGEFKEVAGMLAVIIPLFNVLSVICFETLRGNRVKLGSILRRITTNPLILAAILGAACSLEGVHLPVLLRQTVNQLSAAAAPVGLIVLGACFSLQDVIRSRGLVASVTLLRLLAVPVIFLTGACLLGIRGGSLVGLLGMYASPCAIASAPMAYEMGGDGKLAGQFVATTSALCPFTLFIVIAGLKAFSML